MLSNIPLEYNKSAQLTQNEQMLINLIRARYFEQPFFLQIGSISTSFSYGVNAGGSIQFPRENLPFLGVVRLMTGTLGWTYQELPTFTLAPLQGNQYFKHMLKNIDLSQLALLEHWDFGFIMNTLVERIGNLYNDPSDENKSYKDFLELEKVLSRLRQRKDLETLYQAQAKGKSQPGYYLRLKYNDREEAERVETLLGISKKLDFKDGEPLIGIYRLVQAIDLYEEKEDEAGRPILPIKLLSFLEVLGLMGQGVEVPEKHLKKGFVMALETTGIRRPPHVQLIRVKHSPSRPENAYIAVTHRGYWFYIEDSDIGSKQAFAFLNLLYSLQSRSGMSQQPALTIPVR
jgi:hypothetical protein